MLELFKGFIREQKPDYILELKVAHSQQLYAATCKYARQDKYYAVTSFFTDAWIGSNPAGPLVGGVETECRKLEDVATIREFPTRNLCMTFPVITDDELTDYVARIKTSTVHQFSSIFEHNKYGDRIETTLTLAPIPALLVRVLNGDSLVGTLVVLTNGSAYPVLCCDPRLNEYVNLICGLLGGQGQPCRVGGVRRLSLSEGGD